MKNLKKVLALALVFAMTLTLFAGAAFNDADSIGVDYRDDVNMLVELGVLKGYEDNTFRPENDVTRAEFAKMAYTLKYGYDDQGQLFMGQKSQFTDVEGVSSIAWAKGYINYCANQKIISGVGNNKFNPNGKVTVAEAAKMLLVILGCDPQTEGLVGMNWQGNTVAKAIELGIFDGWVGDPTAPASRQLVAKLMRNTIFAPIYIYSPITGAGSQSQMKNDGTLAPNATLGVKTMGLKHESGIVVANERYAINHDDEGENFGLDVAPTGDEEKSIIAFKDADDVWQELTINVGLEDAAIGTLVDVYYKYNKETKKDEIIGNVLTNAKTVVYEVNAANIDIFPNGESKKKGDVKPEIVFTTDDGEIRVAAPAVDGKTVRVPQQDEYYGSAFAAKNMFYEITADPKDNLVGEYKLVTGDEDALKTETFVKNMGADNTLATYRLISLNGGETFSYIFSNPNASFGKIASISESKGTISAANVLGSNTDLEDVVLYDGAQKGDYVVAKAENGKAVLYPTVKIDGTATSWEDNSAVIDGETYYGYSKFDSENPVLADFFSIATNRSATFYAFDNMLLAHEETAASTDVSGYAVVLKSAVDKVSGDATLRLGLADGSVETYTVNNYTDLSLGLQKASEGELDTLLNLNKKFGYIVNYTVRDGKINVTERAKFDQAAYTYAEEVLAKDGASTKYFAGENSTIFMLYSVSETSRAVSFKTYNLLNDVTGAVADDVVLFDEEGESKEIGGAAIMPISKKSDEILVAALTVGIGKTPNFSAPAENAGYIVSSKVVYDEELDAKCVNVSLISLKDKAVVSGLYKDADDVEDMRVGTVLDAEDAPYAIGSVAKFSHNGDEFTALDIESDGEIASMKGALSSASAGYYYATIVGMSKTRISFYDFDAVNAPAPMVGDEIDDSNLQAKQINEDRFESVAISADGEVLGEEVEIYDRDSVVAAGDYNAIVHVDGNKIDAVFSLYNNIG